MKKLVLISLLAVLGISFAFSQSIYGLRGGLNISNYSGDPDMDAKIGFHGGMVMQAHLHPLLILQPELLYTQRGAQAESNIIGDVKETLHYVELPILAKLNLGTGNLKFQPYLGPEFRYLIKGNRTVKMGNIETTNEIDDYTDFDFGLGLGMDIVFNTNMLFGARYSMGLMDIYDGNAEVKTNAIMINLGFLY